MAKLPFCPKSRSTGTPTASLVDKLFEDELNEVMDSVGSLMRTLMKHGPEGHAVLRHDELLYRGYWDPVPKNGAPSPVDLEYWKAKVAYFSGHVRRIRAEGFLNFQTRKFWRIDRIMDWIPEPLAIPSPFPLWVDGFEVSVSPLPPSNVRGHSSVEVEKRHRSSWDEARHQIVDNLDESRSKRRKIW